MKRLFSLLGAALLLLIIVLVVNTLRDNKSLPNYTVDQSFETSGDSAAQHLSQAIQIKTVSFGDTLAIDTAEFLKFRKFIETTYPNITSKLSKQTFNEFSYVYKWTGKDTSLAPYVLMGHMDVVPVEAVAESKWTVPSFSGAIKNDTIWGKRCCR